MTTPQATESSGAKEARPEPRQELSLAEKELVARTRWLILSRWLAAVGVLVVPMMARHAFGVGFSVEPVIVISIAIAAYNAVFWWTERWLRTRQRVEYRTLVIFANVQICIDLFVLTVLIHYTGGVDNPFLFFYVFHMIISGILLPRVDAYLQATYATILFVSMALLEFYGAIPHVRMTQYLPEPNYDKPQVVAGVCAALVSCLYLSAYMATSIAQSLRRNQARLEETYRDLAALSASRSVFFREASHELRAPLVAMRSCLGTVLGDYVGSITEKQRDMIQRAYDRIDYLLGLVNDLLQLSWLRSISKPAKKESVDLSGAVADAVDLMAQTAAENGVTVHNAVEPIHVEGDRSALHHLIMNLLSNAIKYNRQGGSVRVSSQTTNNDVILEIADTGMGIAEEEREKLFQEFYRSPRAKEAVKIGTGVGLAIVKRVVEMHHGEITLESQMDQGTTFRVKLPLQQPER